MLYNDGNQQKEGGGDLDTFSDQADRFFWNLFNRPEPKDLLDILVVAFLLYKLLMLTRETRAGQVIKGFGLLIAASWISDLVGLTALNWTLMTIVNNGPVVLLILFQPEFRRALEQLGRGAKIERLPQNTDENSRIIGEITQSLLNLSRRRVGALLVFERRTGLKDFIDTGHVVDALITAPLLNSIFEPNTPLHDGAVIIRRNRIVAAACVLTLSESPGIARDLGTRHRAGLGISESTDAVVLIVSEETGIISMAQAGKLTRHLDAEGLQRILGNLYESPDSAFSQFKAAARARLSDWRARRDVG